MITVGLVRISLVARSLANIRRPISLLDSSQISLVLATSSLIALVQQLVTGKLLTGKLLTGKLLSRPSQLNEWLQTPSLSFFLPFTLRQHVIVNF
jgi:hypothetical protein